MKKNKSFILLFMTMVLLSGMVTACSDSDSETEGIEDAFSFEVSSSVTTSRAKDFKMSDIDVLANVALKMEGIRLEYAKMMSNGWNNELYSGPGKYTDGTKFFDYLTDLLDNSDAYYEALDRLEKDGVLSTPTVTRGTGIAFYDWCVSLALPIEETHDKMMTILTKNKVLGNKEAMQQLFDLVPEKHRCGETDAQKWFTNLINGEYITKTMSIHNTWIHSGEGFGAVSKYLEKYEELYDKGPGNPHWEDCHVIIKDVAEKGGSFYVSCIDEVTGGAVGKVSDINEISEATLKLANKIREGKATTDDLKLFVSQLGPKYVKEHLGDMIGEDPGGLERLGGEITDFAATHATAKAEEDVAKGLGLNLYEIQKTSIQGIAVAIIEDIKAGNITIGFPGKDGNTRIITKPGAKNITVVNTNGERITQKVTEKSPGKVEVEAEPGPTKAILKATPTTINISSKGGNAAIKVETNCQKGRIRYPDGKKPEWLNLSRNSNTITVSAGKNTTGKTLTATFIIEGSLDGKQFDATATINVTQVAEKTEDNPTGKTDGPTVTPQQLQVPAVGGALSVKATFNGYTNCNHVLSSSAAKWIAAGWNVDYVTPKRHTNQYYVIVAPNDTKKARTDTLKIYFANSQNASEKERYYTPVVIKQEAGPYNLQDLSKLFVGTWWNPNEGADNLGGYMYYRFTFKSNGSYTMESKYNKSKGADTGKWTVAQEGTYTVTSYKIYNTCLRVNIKLTYKDSKGNKHTDDEICEMYPHFMRMVATYMERQE